MSDWPKYNEDLHRISCTEECCSQFPYYNCSNCQGDICQEDWPCRCCLTSDISHLREVLDQLQEEIAILRTR